MVRSSVLLLSLALLLSACEMQEGLPSAASDGGSAAVAFRAPSRIAPSLSAVPLDELEAESALRHVVLLKGSLQDLEQEVTARGGTVVFSHAETGFAVVEGLTDASAAELGSSPFVGDIQPDVDLPLDVPFATDPELGGPSAASPGEPTDAAYFARQWNMRAIGADAAWAAGRLGSPDVTIAILDTGVDYLHADLEGRVDLDRSISFAPEGGIDDLNRSYYFPDRHPVTDLHYHGTHAAATAASNAAKAAGVTSQTTIIGVKVCPLSVLEDEEGNLSVGPSCPLSAVFSGLLHATDNGADVINMSFGGVFSKAGLGRYVAFINSTLNYVQRQGATVVVAAGNDAADLDHNGNVYSTYCDTPNTVCVSATGPADSGPDYRYGPWYDIDSPATYTNYGRSAIDVAAPGGNVYRVAYEEGKWRGGWIYAACSTSSLYYPHCWNKDKVIGLTGTSMAAPHVAGLAALLVEDYGRNPSRIRSQLQQSADDLGQRGTDPYYGKGRINVAKALGLDSGSAPRTAMGRGKKLR